MLLSTTLSVADEMIGFVFRFSSLVQTRSPPKHVHKCRDGQTQTLGKREERVEQAAEKNQEGKEGGRVETSESHSRNHQ